MITEEQMTIDERYKYLRKMQARYRPNYRPSSTPLGTDFSPACRTVR